MKFTIRETLGQRISSLDKKDCFSINPRDWSEVLLKSALVIFASSVFLLTGCKSDIGFQPTDDSSQTDGNGQANSDGSPTVRVIKSPKNRLFGEDNKISYEVIKGRNEVAQVECFLNGVKIDCDQKGGVIDVSYMDHGPHQLRIVVTDTEGLVGQIDERWSVYKGILQQSETLQLPVKNEVDILFVINDSSSMHFDLRWSDDWREKGEVKSDDDELFGYKYFVGDLSRVLENFRNFIGRIDDRLDWHIGITSTKSGRNSYYDGRLVSFSNGDYYLTRTVGLDVAKGLFQKNIQGGRISSGDEQGIYNTYRAIERATNEKMQLHNEMKSFFREDAFFSVILISDGDESGDDEKSNPNNLIDYVRTSFGQDKNFQFHSIIAHTQDCLKKDVHNRHGQRYEELSTATGGFVGDICADDYSEAINAIAEKMLGDEKIVPLGCAPQDINNNGQIDMTVTPIDFNVQIPKYEVDGRRVIFHTGLPKGKYRFDYHCFTY